jgi:hypothetical protein
METIISSYKHLLLLPEQINSFPDFLMNTLQLIILALLLAWPTALCMKLMLDRERLGTASRIRFAVTWAAVVLGFVAVCDAGVLLILDRVPHWTAVAPHSAMALCVGVYALIQYFKMRSEVTVLKTCVDNANRRAA